MKVSFQYVVRYILVFNLYEFFKIFYFVSVFLVLLTFCPSFCVIIILNFLAGLQIYVFPSWCVAYTEEVFLSFSFLLSSSVEYICNGLGNFNWSRDGMGSAAGSDERGLAYIKTVLEQVFIVQNWLENNVITKHIANCWAIIVEYNTSFLTHAVKYIANKLQSFVGLAN